MLRWKLYLALAFLSLALPPNVPTTDGHALSPSVVRPAETRHHRLPAQDTGGSLSRAQQALEAGRHPEAIRLLREVLEDEPERPELWYTLAVALLESGEPGAAVEAYDRSLELAPGVAASWCGKGLALGALQRHAESATALERCAELSPDDPRARLNLGIARLRAGRPAEALPPLRHAVDRVETARAAAPPLLVAARQLAGRGDPDATVLACGAYRDYLKASPDDAMARAELAQLYAGLHLRADAVATAGRVVEMGERGAADAGALIVAGNALHRARWPDRAARAFEVAVALTPEDPWAHHHLGLALADQQRLERALEEFREAARLDPEFLEPRVEAARAHLSLGRPAEAIALLGPVSDRLADDPGALVLLARAHLADDDPAAAVQTLEPALERTREPELLYALGRAHERLGNAERARDLLREFEASRAPPGRAAPSEPLPDMWTGDRLLTQARIYLAERRFDEALELLEDARGNRPDSAELRELVVAAREGVDRQAAGRERADPATEAGRARRAGAASGEPGPSGSGAPRPSTSPADPDRRTIRLGDVTRALGVDFRHERGATADKLLPETMGAGVAWLDYDGDGDWDLYLVQSGVAVPAAPGAGGPDRRGDVLYRNLGDGGLRPAPAAGGGPDGYGMGVASADYDADGFPDLLVTSYGSNVLYRNNGDGTFADVTATAGLEGAGWSTSAGWGDLDADGFPDLYVARYVDFRADTAPRCGDPATKIRTYCHVDLFAGTADRVYRNGGDGTFSGVAASTGMANESEGKGLGVGLGDVDGDGRTDIYVANDRTRNFLYLNRGDWTFEDVGLMAGVGYGEAGLPEAGMGVALGDVDGDGAPEIAVTNFAGEPTDLYRRHGPELWMEESSVLGVGAPTRATLGFGVALVDLDADGDLDLLQANGHIMDNVESIQDGYTYAQPDQLLVNRLDELGAGRPERRLFVDATAEVPALAGPRVSRGLAVADHDRDGRPDVAITTSGGPPQVLRNETEGGRRLVLRLRGRRSNRDALGARVVVIPDLPEGGGVAADPGVGGATPGSAPAPARRAQLEVTGGSSYLSQSATDLYVGLGRASSATVEVRWPSGDSLRLEDGPADRLVLLVEGRDDVVASRPLGR